MAEPAEEVTVRDLGLSGRIAQTPKSRIMRPDGTFNVVRIGHGFWQSLNVYQHMITASWPTFFFYVGVFYIIANAIFASLFVAAGPGAIRGGETGGIGAEWHNAIFFSVQTIATIGYGQMTPHGTLANTLVAIEALTGLMGFALITGILFARFSRPSALILRSSVAVVAPYKDGEAFMFRIANGRTVQLLELHATVTYSWMEDTSDGRRVRRFRTLPLERDSVVLLPTQWVIVHPIDETSPFGPGSPHYSPDAAPEIFVAISAVDESFSQTVHSRFSYAVNEIVHSARFVDIFGTTSDGTLTMDLSKLSDIDRVTYN